MAPRRTQVLSLVARAAGAAGMIGGQADDLAAGAIAGSAASERLISIHRRKTGALITASVLAGAVIAGAGEEIERLRRYGEAIGLAFQIVDDILDVESTTAVLGKSAGKDARDLKLTFPAVLGPAESRRRAEKLCREAQAEARALGPRAAAQCSACFDEYWADARTYPVHDVAPHPFTAEELRKGRALLFPSHAGLHPEGMAVQPRVGAPRRAARQVVRRVEARGLGDLENPGNHRVLCGEGAPQAMPRYLCVWTLKRQRGWARQ